MRFRAGTTTAAQDAAVAANGGILSTAFLALRIRVISVPAVLVDETVRAYLADPAVSSVELDRVREADGAPSDPGYGDQWNLPQVGWGIARDSVAPSGHAVIAVLDTGVDGGHPDLSGLVTGGWSAFGTDPLADPNGHGTAVAGIAAAATGNGIGIAGVAYAGTSVLSVQVLGADGAGTDSDIIAGVVWAADHGADVILMAFSNPGYSAALQAAIDYAWSRGAVLVAATGNDGSTTATYPAGDRHVIGVSGTDRGDRLVAGSNSGADTFLGAPGVDIPTAAAGGGTTLVTGTSAAAAHVAGAAALLRAIGGSASNGVIVGRLARTADPAGAPDQTGNGRLNLGRAVTDASMAVVDPVGAPSGGPFPGPYLPPYAAAAACDWSGATSADWNAGANWTCGHVPGSTGNTADTVTIGTGHTSYPSLAGTAMIAGGTISAGSLTILTGGSLTVSGANLYLNGGTLTVSAGGSLTVASGTTLTLGGGALAVSGAVAVIGALNQTSGSSTINSGGALTVTGTAAASTGSVTVASGGTLTIGSGATMTVSSTATLNVSSQVTVAGTLSYIGGTVTIGSGGTMTVAGSSEQPAAITKSATGTFTIASGGTLTIGAYGTLTQASGTMTTASGGTVNVTGTATVASTFTMSGALNVNAGATVSTTSAWTVAGGSVVTQTGGTILAAAALTVAGSITQSAGTLHMSAVLTTKPTSAGTITLSSGGSVTQSGGVIDVYTYTAASGSTFTQSGGTFRNYYNFSNSGTFIATAGTYERAGTNSSSGFTSPGTNQFYNVLVDAGVTFYVRSSSTPAPVISVKGDWTVNGTANLTSGSSNTDTVAFNGPGTQTIGGTAATTFRNLTVNKTTGTVVLAKTTTVGKASPAIGTLSLQAGAIVTGSNTLIVFRGSSSTRSGGFVEGNLQKAVATGSNVSVTFEVGTGSTYAPITVVYASVTTQGTLTVSTTAGQHPQISSSSIAVAADVARYWTLTSATTVFTTATAAFQFVAGDVTGGTPSSFIAQRFNAGWTTPAAGSRTATTNQVTGLTSTSIGGSFAVGLQVTPAASGAGTVTVDPSSVTAGTAGNSFDFTFTAPPASYFASGSAVRVTVPAGWTAPQMSDAGAPGYVSSTSGTCTPGAVSVAGAGPWTITVAQACAQATSFVITYGADTSTAVTVPKVAVTSAFTSLTQAGSGGTLTAIAASPTVAVNADAASRLEVLLPGMSAAPGTTAGYTGSPSATTAGSRVTLTVNATDVYWNVIPSATQTVTITTTDPNATLPASAALVSGTGTFQVTLKTTGSHTVTAAWVSGSPALSAGTSPAITVNPGAASKLRILLPGETAAAGTPSGKAGTPTPVTAGAAVLATVSAVDANWNVASGATPTVAITSTDLDASLPSPAALVGGTGSFSITPRTAGSWTITATDQASALTSATSASIAVSAGAASRLQVLLPGETADPGSATGRAGTPTATSTGSAVTITVNAVDAYWNKVTTATPTVAISSTDTNASLPADAALVLGTQTFSTTFKTAGSRSVTATYASGTPTVSPGTSTSVTVNAGTATTLQILLPG